MNKIKDKDIKLAAAYAFVEADNWYVIGKIIEEKIKTEKRLHQQCAVIKLLAIELYLKTILLCNGINISEINSLRGSDGHKIFKLYNKLPNNLRIKIKETIDYKPIIIEDRCIIAEYKTFEDALNKISNDFIELRYEFDKVSDRPQIVVLYSFIIKLETVVKELAYKCYYNKEKI